MKTLFSNKKYYFHLKNQKVLTVNIFILLPEVVSIIEWLRYAHTRGSNLCQHLSVVIVTADYTRASLGLQCCFSPPVHSVCWCNSSILEGMALIFEVEKYFQCQFFENVNFFFTNVNIRWVINPGCAKRVPVMISPQ